VPNIHDRVEQAVRERPGEIDIEDFGAARRMTDELKPLVGIFAPRIGGDFGNVRELHGHGSPRE